ncbi:MAG: PocR ligand-binding domain-containing protein [Myxococcales bacterium]|nr:PocR ligand-binding domain-containing protein [Myxococcales bacterium]
MAEAPVTLLDELTMGRSVELESLVDKGALREMAESARELFGVSLRIFSESGNLLADASGEPPLYAYLDEHKAGRDALASVISAVKSLEPEADTEADLTCVTGARYIVRAISYDGRRLGRLILGPYRDPAAPGPSAELTRLDAGIDGARVASTWLELPAFPDQQARRIVRHLCHALDLILFSGHKALLTSNMHLMSVQESYRELADKNAKLQHAFDRLKELDRLKSNFLGTVSHELRTPLTSIIGYSEMLKEGIAGELTKEQQEFVHTIHEKGEQLLGLIKGLLDLSKLESGTMSLRKAEIDIVPLIRDVAQTLAPAARKKLVEISVESEPGLPTVWADVERLRQVFLNLSENALKFTPEQGRVTLSVRASVLERRADDEGRGLVLFSTKRPAIEVRVIDTGIGVPDAEKERVFDAFYQVDGSATREHEGTGLGLSIVRRLIDAHDGTVRVEDNVPRGAVFVVTIPCRRTTIA